MFTIKILKIIVTLNAHHGNWFCKNSGKRTSMSSATITIATDSGYCRQKVITIENYSDMGERVIPLSVHKIIILTLQQLKLR